MFGVIWDLSSFLIWAFCVVSFSLNTALAVSQRFWYVVSLFSLVSKNFLVSNLILLFTQKSFKSRLFNFHVTVVVLSFLLLSSNLHCDLRDCYNFYSFAFAEECFASNYVINFKVSAMWHLGECIFYYFWVESSVDSYQVHLIQSKCQVLNILVNFLSRWSNIDSEC